MAKIVAGIFEPPNGKIPSGFWQASLTLLDQALSIVLEEHMSFLDNKWTVFEDYRITRLPDYPITD